MTIYLGADHGGFQLKEQIKKYLQQQGYGVEDLGANQLDPDDDYPEIAWKVATKVAKDEQNRGILLCRSGGGMVIVANKVINIRAVAVGSEEAAEHARVHNNANIISLAADWVDSDKVEIIIDKFLKTNFDDNSRHQRRIVQISHLEKQ